MGRLLNTVAQGLAFDRELNPPDSRQKGAEHDVARVVQRELQDYGYVRASVARGLKVYLSRWRVSPRG